MVTEKSKEIGQKSEVKKDGEKNKAKIVEDEDLSDEDKQLKDELLLCVQRLTENDEKLYKPALEILRTKIKESTSSMTSVPKPLKFLRNQYDTLKGVYEKIVDKTTKEFCADILSVLGMTISEKRECLKYRYLSSRERVGEWGHEYVRHLTSELTAQWNQMDEREGGGQNAKEKRVELIEERGEEKSGEKDGVDEELTWEPEVTISKEDLLKLAQEMVAFYMAHNAEADACDLLMEIEHIHLIESQSEKDTYQRVCLYLLSCVPYVAEPEDSILIRTALKIYQKFEQDVLALRCAIQLNDMDLMQSVFYSCADPLLTKQLAFVLARQQIYWEIDESRVQDADQLTEIMNNSRLSQNFLNLARELDIMEAKVPEDIYKSHLETSRSYQSQVDSARQNLAASFVNGFVNAAFAKDKLMSDDKEANVWIHKNKEHGIMSTTATLGLLSLWDVENGLTQIDKYLYSDEDYVKAGALLACGIVNAGVQNECDPALALLSDYVNHKNNSIRIASILGLGIAYAGKNRQDAVALISTILSDSSANMEVIGVAALSLGLIGVGSANGEITSTLMQTLLERSEQELKDTFSKFLALGIGLVYLGKGEQVDVILESLKAIPEPLQSLATILVDVCAYAGSGNVLKVQQLLSICSEHIEVDTTTKDAKDAKDDKEKKEKKDDSTSSSSGTSTGSGSSQTSSNMHQAVAVLGISLIGMNEEIGAEMALRTFGHLLHYGEPVIKRAVPLALGLISLSNPKLNILDTLSKFSHDADAEVAHNSIFAMGLVGAGTNNARLAAMLRQLAMYHAKDQNNLFMVRLAQGLTHMGKGTMTISPYHSHKFLLNRVAVGGLLAVLVSFLDVKNIILAKSHYMLFNLALAMQPRMLITFDEKLNPLPITVRVGQAVDVVGQAGKPKTITGFQTHTTPVLLAYGERAELATDEFISLTPVLEGFAILRKNPDHMEH
ncbi:26S proteasome non-ATPase regulatory subunit 2 [Brachionus plicatilis]|uniref:26S proteasome non-ATPase regulatory subunit 2 n=1 Tax=Brachionus plicatilis TaxID=10195 RepID=A0A3M7SV11_BRAPC|nr:26S proteasome non-ATPase regulatory subunit 2 [Brachionus plicatilis]